MRFRYSVMATFMLFFPFLLFSQSGSDKLSELYRFVERIDSLPFSSQRTFYLQKFLENNADYKETWRYAENGGKVNFFQVDYVLDSTEFTEVYYLNRGNLVCSEEYETVNYSYNDDELRWGGIFYFQSAVPKHVVTIGKQYQHHFINSPELIALNRFEKRFSELRRHIPMLP